uniref:(northern house mosquito) hypothetical protein n=1 Tax=Culex pipiens TaxID=7175 RepID=A0A8D8HTK3_CULPI
MQAVCTEELEVMAHASPVLLLLVPTLLEAVAASEVVLGSVEEQVVAMAEALVVALVVVAASTCLMPSMCLRMTKPPCKTSMTVWPPTWRRCALWRRPMQILS